MSAESVGTDEASDVIWTKGTSMELFACDPRLIRDLTPSDSSPVLIFRDVSYTR